MTTGLQASKTTKLLLLDSLLQENSCQSLRKNTLPLKNDCASGIEGCDYWAVGKSSHLQYCSPKNMCLEHEANSSNLRIQPRFKRNLFISNFKKQQFLHSHL